MFGHKRLSREGGVEIVVKELRRTNRAYGGLPLSDPPWACLLLYQIKN